MIASIKQRSMLALIIDKQKDEHNYFKQIWEGQPMYNEQFPNKDVDNRQLILTEKFKDLTGDEAYLIIGVYQYGIKGYAGKNIKEARRLLTNLKLI